MDLKCPSSGEVERNLFTNIAHLKSTDEIKFVIGTVEDYEWAKHQIAAHKLDSICPLLFSWVHPLAPEQQSKVLKKVPARLTPIQRRELAEKSSQMRCPSVSKSSSTRSSGHRNNEAFEITICDFDLSPKIPVHMIVQS